MQQKSLMLNLKTSACWEHQLWRSLHVEVFVSYLQWFLYQMAKMWRDVNVWRHIQLSLDLYITQWNKIHDSKTCVWTQHRSFSSFHLLKKYMVKCLVGTMIMRFFAFEPTCFRTCRSNVGRLQQYFEIETVFKHSIEPDLGSFVWECLVLVVLKKTMIDSEWAAWGVQILYFEVLWEFFWMQLMF